MDISKYIKADGTVDWNLYWDDQENPSTGFTAQCLKGYWEAVEGIN